MSPGQMFVHTDWVWVDSNRQEPRSRLMVVIDRLTEVDFWEGGMFAFGDVMPGVFFEVPS